MKPLLPALLLLAACAPAHADTITMKDGKSIAGSILFNNDQLYYVSTAEGVKAVPIAEVERIDFDPKAPAVDSEVSE
ncbi:MAG TPA: hypothetical protein VL404_08045 [Candidatus Eisenbacteria bacterium]|nr:hypothetical protein [Candidatus Eisenbacteria bacterium]